MSGPQISTAILRINQQPLTLLIGHKAQLFFFWGGGAAQFTQSAKIQNSTSHASLLKETPTHPFTQPSWISHTIIW